MGKQESPHFDISAAVIKQLGEELVTDEVTAIMELIKNSYDADADWVSVEVNTVDIYSETETHYENSRPGYIVIRDNGFGMSDDDIVNGWMKISLSSKKKFKSDGLLTPKKRTPLGEKGVGRLSTQRLGSRLELFTGKSNDSNQNHVAFDWDLFDDHTSLSRVPVYFDIKSKSLREKGTSLVITNLKDANKWTGRAWDTFRGQISQMIFPFKDERVFNVFLKLNNQPVDLDELHAKVINNSVGKFKFGLHDNKIKVAGYIKLQKLSGSNKKDDELFFENSIQSDNGEDFFSFLTDQERNKKDFLEDVRFSGKKGTFIVFNRTYEFSSLDKMAFTERTLEDGDEEVKIAYPGNFHGELYDFYFKESNAIENAFDSLSEFKRIVQNQVGVRIFRDGFGIKPYGIDGQDWLSLAGGQTHGSSFYGLRPGNILGFISISAVDNKNLKEKTDREGFVDNSYSSNFFEVTKVIITEINNVLEKTRRSYNSYKSNKGKEQGGIQGVEDSFNKVGSTSGKAKNFSKRAKDLSVQLQSVSERITAISKTSTRNLGPEDIKRLKLLEDAGNLLNQAQALLVDIEDLLEDVKKLNHHVEYLKPMVESLEQQLADFSELAGLGLTAEALSHELSNIVDRILQETQNIQKKTKGKSEVPISLLNIYIEYIRSASKSFRKQLSHIAPSLRYVRESKEIISIEKLFEEYQDFYSERFSNEIQVKSKVHGSDFSVKLNKGKLTQVIDNIVINSEYWLKEKKRRNPKFVPMIRIQCKEPFIRISDNGDGIEPSIENRIFQPFVSFKPKKVGRGLGLFIVQQLLESAGCSISLLNEKNEHGRRYIFQINLSNVIP